MIAEPEQRERLTYVTIVGVFFTLLGLLVTRERKAARPFDPSPRDLALLGAATFRVGRIAAFSRVTEPLRDPVTQTVPDEFAVHSLEHGAVWLTHAPDLPAEQAEALAGLAQLDQEYVLVSPYDDLAAPVVAVAWGITLEVESADDPRLVEFVEAYAGGAQGGEPGVPCRQGGVSPREARGLLGGTAA